MIHEFILHSGVRFSDEDKQKCLPTARRIVQLADIAGYQGILALENEVLSKDTDSYFMKMGVRAILNGMSSDVMQRIFTNYLLADEYTGADLLDKLLIAEGLWIISEGVYPFHSPLAVAHIIGAMLGEKYMDEIANLANTLIDVDFMIEEHTLAFAESENFEKKLLASPDFKLMPTLMAIDNAILARAFQGCNKSFIYKMRASLSNDSFMRVCEHFQLMGEIDKELLLQHQEIVLNHLEDLEASEFITHE